MVAKTIVITGGSTFTLPADWSPLSNTIHVIGAGEDGPGADFNYTAGPGGRSGCYARIDNFNHPPGTVCSLHVGVSGSPDTWFFTTATIVAKGAQTTTAGCVGALVRPGSLGGGSPDGGLSGGGGAGAPGPHGDGLPGDLSGAGGAPDAGVSGASTQWTDSVSGLQYGPGQGGDGGAYQHAGPSGGLYGSGGGAAGASGSVTRNAGGAGRQGLIVLVYTVSAVIAATEAPDAAVFSGVVFGDATIAAAEAPDVALFRALASAFGPLVAAEPNDNAALAGIISTVGAVAAIEAADSAALSGTVFLNVTLASTEGPDVPAFVGKAEFDAVLSAQESSDRFAGVAFLPAIIDLEAVEGADQALFPAMLGATWPRLDIRFLPTESGDVALATVAAGPIGNLEYEGVGGKLLYTASGPLERALADVDVARMMAIPARLITENLDPWKVESKNLVFLAYGMGVTLWEPAWSESTRREWVAEQWSFKQAIGSLPAFRMALAASGYEIADYVTPPGGFFVSPDLTVDETNAWIRQMPQIRIKFANKTGVEGADEMFAEPDGAVAVLDGVFVAGPPSGVLLHAGASPSTNIVLNQFSTSSVSTTPGRNDSFWDDAEIGLDDGRALYGNIAVLRKADGTELPLEMWDIVETTTQSVQQIFYQTSVPVFLPDADFIDEDFVDDARYASPDAGEGKIYSFIVPEVVNVTTPSLAMTPLVPGLKPLTVAYDIESDIEYDLIPSAFTDDWGVNIEYLTPDDGPLLLAHVMHLLDPAVTVPMTAGVSFVDESRIGIPSDYAELAINTHTLLPNGTFSLDDNWIDESSYAAPEDLTDFDRAGRAVVAAKALRDTILINFEQNLTTDTPVNLQSPGPVLPLGSPLAASEAPDDIVGAVSVSWSVMMVVHEQPDSADVDVSN
jgi:phage tail P2-like protein